jgi:NAD-dependent protein deacetylase/lipoamidase
MSVSRTTSQADAALQKAAGLLRSARHAVVFTGAGISTPSGIPDFRSKVTGLWERDDPMEVASLWIFQSHPEKFYNWLRPLLESIWKAQPNPAHTALAQMEAAGLIKAVITQNIDNLHQQAGSRHIYELHGSLRTVSCSACRETYPSEQFRGKVENGEDVEESTRKELPGDDGLPHCPHCRRVLKPDIVLFGEMLPFETWQAAENHCKQADVILVAGSSLEVWPAASLPELAAENGAHLIVNNLTPTYLDQSADVLLPWNVAEVLPKIASLVL